MSLRAKLEDDVKQAMREKNTLARDTLRMCLAAVKNRVIEKGGEVDDADVIAVLSKAVKSREDSAQQFRKAGRIELAEKEEAEVKVISVYLPKLMGEAETRALVERLIAENDISSKKDMGVLMKAIMAGHKGEVDGKIVQRLAGELLQ